MHEPHLPLPDHGDLSPEEFRRYAHAVVDWMADYLASSGTYPVLPPIRPGDVAARLPTAAPEMPEPMEVILNDFREVIVPGMTHWNHPSFFAYFAITGSAPGILGEMLAAAMNVNAMLWRTGPAPTELEERVLDWLRQMMGLPAGLHGTIHDTASISSLTAIAAAREALDLGIREQGMSGRALPRLRLYCSEEAHSSIEKAGIALGIGREGTRRIPTDAEYRMDPQALARAVEEDLAAGWKPFCVVATVGTTSTTSIDPVPAVADVCARYGLWLHVDAAYGGAAALVPEMREVLDGCDRANSLVVNPHKWMFVPVDCSVLYVRDPEVVRRAFSVLPEYLVTPEGSIATNLMDYGPALGRRFRSLKLWMVLRTFGTRGMASRIREHVRLARELAGWIDAEPGWERIAPVPFSVVVFRHTVPGASEAENDAHNERVLNQVNATGEAFLSHTRLRGHYALRLAIGNLHTKRQHVRRAWELLARCAGTAP